MSIDYTQAFDDAEALERAASCALFDAEEAYYVHRSAECFQALQDARGAWDKATDDLLLAREAYAANTPLQRMKRADAELEAMLAEEEALLAQKALEDAPT